MDNKECQTTPVVTKTSETNTGDCKMDLSEEEYKIIEELNGSLDKYIEDEEEEEDDEMPAENTAAKDLEVGESAPDDSPDAGTHSSCTSSRSDHFTVLIPSRTSQGSLPRDHSSEAIPVQSEQQKNELEISSSNLGIWEKIERIQSLSCNLPSESSSVSDNQVKEIKCLVSFAKSDYHLHNSFSSQHSL